MGVLFSVHHAATWALVGLIWTIQLVHYPLFAKVGRETFAAYHLRHTRQVTWLVAPLMLGEIVTAAWLVFAGSRDPWLLASLVPLGFNWVSTGLVQVPLHQKLAHGYDAGIHQKLVTTNWGRTLAWSLRGVCLLMAGQ